MTRVESCFLGTSYIINSLAIVLTITECLIHPPFISRYVWMSMSAGLFLFSLFWLGVLYVNKKKPDWFSYRYGLYAFSSAVNGLILCAIVIPTGFSTSGISDERFKDYLIVFPLISSLTIISGVYVGFKTSGLNLDGIFF